MEPFIEIQTCDYKELPRLQRGTDKGTSQTIRLAFKLK